MSLITSFEYRGDRTARFQTQHRCGWFYTNDPDRGRILQLETYAKDGTTGQIFQFDQRMADELVGIIAKVFHETDSQTV